MSISLAFPHTHANVLPTQHHSTSLNSTPWCSHVSNRGWPAKLHQEQTTSGPTPMEKSQQAMFTLLVGVRNLSTLISFSVALHHDHTHVLLTYRCFFSNVSSAKLTFKASQDKQRASIVATSNMDTTFPALRT